MSHPALRAGALYALSAFLIGFGFVFGAVRVTLVAPRVGAFAAVALEAAPMLIACWFVSRIVVARAAVPAAAASRLAMGAWALALLLAAETALGVVGFGRTLTEQFAAWATPAGALGLAAQVAFALLPVAQGEWERRRG
jgi:hypothetical protein